MWKMKSLEGAPVVERNEEFPIDSVGISRIYLAVCLLSVPFSQLPFLCSCGPLISVKGFGALKCFCFRCQESLSSSTLV